MDIPLKRPRNPSWVKLKRLLLMGVGLFALVFGIGALPVAVLYFAGETQKPPPQTSEQLKQPEAKQKQVVVNVVPMDKERVLTGRTVIVKDGLIAALESVPRAVASALRYDHKADRARYRSRY